MLTFLLSWPKWQYPRHRYHEIADYCPYNYSFQQVKLMRALIKKFTELSTDELYDLLALRTAVFVVEQKIVYQDIDFRDQEAFHVLLYSANEMMGYARILPYKNGEGMSFGRVLVKHSFRGLKAGELLVEHCLRFLQQEYPGEKITIHAQEYLKNFYEKFGFQVISEPFELEEIMHLLMVKQS